MYVILVRQGGCQFQFPGYHHESPWPDGQWICHSPTGRSISVSNRSIGRREVRAASPVAAGKKTCMCSSTTHPGSFRCSLHKNLGHGQGQGHGQCQGQGQGQGQFSSSRSLNFRRSAMTNSLVRICSVEGDLVKRSLAALIRPSSHQMRRRVDFKPRQSRLFVISRAEDS